MEFGELSLGVVMMQERRKESMAIGFEGNCRRLAVAGDGEEGRNSNNWSRNSGRRGKVNLGSAGAELRTRARR